MLGPGLAAEILISYRQYEKVLRWLCLSLLSYFAVLVVANVDWSAVASSLIPSVDNSKAGIAALIALAGTTISPYLFFWQAAEEVEEEGQRTPDVSADHVRAMRGDVFAGMLSGVAVMFAIADGNGCDLHTSDSEIDIQSADQAAQALAPLAGNFASLLFSLGILGTGPFAVPVLAGSTGYAFSETRAGRRARSKTHKGSVVLRDDRRGDRPWCRDHRGRDQSDSGVVFSGNSQRSCCSRAAGGPLEAWARPRSARWLAKRQLVAVCRHSDGGGDVRASRCVGPHRLVDVASSAPS